MYVVDASVWVSRFVEQDKFHQESYDWILTLMSARVSVIEPLLVLPELAGAVARQTNGANGDRAVRLMASLPGVDFVDLDTRLARHAADLASRLQFRGSDAIYLALADDLGMELVSWDDEHLNRCTSVAKVHRPSDLLARTRGET